MNKGELKNKLEKTLEFLNSELSQIRTGRASPTLIEDIEVDAYESKMTVKELGSIMVADPQNLVIVPWDRGLLKNISKAIRESELKLNPVEESDRVRVPTPPLTEERRNEMARVVTAKTEEAKNAMRNIRQDIMKDIEKEFSNKIIGEDEKFRLKDEVDEIVKDFTDKVEKISESKKSDLMTV